MLIFLSKTRNKAEAWRVIAYIPWEKNYYFKKEHASKFEPAIKTFCQQLYEAALKNLKTTQSDGSLDNIELKLGNKSKFANLKIPVMYIIGDNQGGDSICERNINYGLTARQISRMCDVGPDELKKSALEPVIY